MLHSPHFAAKWLIGKELKEFPGTLLSGVRLSSAHYLGFSLLKDTKGHPAHLNGYQVRDIRLARSNR
jgi:hypothetical protein